jgi:hypothetical protein
VHSGSMPPADAPSTTTSIGREDAGGRESMDGRAHSTRRCRGARPPHRRSAGSDRLRIRDDGPVAARPLGPVQRAIGLGDEPLDVDRRVATATPALTVT